MKIAVIGTGGVGGYFGGRLALAGNDVTFIARGEHHTAIRENGLRIIEPEGEFAIQPARVSEQFNSVSTADLVLIGTKAWQVSEIAQTIAPLLGAETMVMPLQNGVMALSDLAAHIAPEHLIGGMCKIFSKIDAPGVIRHMGTHPVIIFGETDGARTERAAWIKYTFDMAGIKNAWAENIESEIWKKFLMICSSALLVVTRTNYGELRSNPATRQLLIELYTEIYQLALAAGIDLPENIVEKTIEAVDQFPAKANSSLTRDVLEGRPSEIEYQNGSVVKLGEKYGVATPLNRFVYYSILPSENKALNRK